MFLKRQGNQEPEQWGPRDAVITAVKHNCDRLGLDHPTCACYAVLGNAGNTIYDLSGNENDGTLNGDAYWSGTDVVIDDSQDFIRVSNSFNVNDGAIEIIGSIGNWTSTSPGQTHYFVDFSDAGANLQIYHWTWGARIYYLIGATEGYFDPEFLAYDEFHIIATWAEGKFYFNGVKKLDLLDTSLPYAPTNIDIGNAYGNLAGYGLDGKIRLLRLWPSAPTAEQVAILNDRPYAMFEPVTWPSYFFITIVQVPAWSQQYLVRKQIYHYLVSKLIYHYATKIAIYYYIAQTVTYYYTARKSTYHYVAKPVSSF